MFLHRFLLLYDAVNWRIYVGISSGSVTLLWPSGRAVLFMCSEYEMSTCVIYYTNSHLFKGGVFDMRAQEGREDARSMKVTMRCIVIYFPALFRTGFSQIKH